MDNKTTRKFTLVVLVIILAVVLVQTPVIGFAQAQTATKILRIGYFPNINHAQAVIGFGSGEFQKELGNKIQVRYTYSAQGHQLFKLF